MIVEVIAGCPSPYAVLPGGAILFSALRTWLIGVRPDQSPACRNVPSMSSVDGVSNTP